MLRAARRGRMVVVVLGAPFVERGVDFGAFATDREVVVGDVYVDAAEQCGEQIAADRVGHTLVQLTGFLK
jgi:hypothetical protein